MLSGTSGSDRSPEKPDRQTRSIVRSRRDTHPSFASSPSSSDPRNLCLFESSFKVASGYGQPVSLGQISTTTLSRIVRRVVRWWVIGRAAAVAAAPTATPAATPTAAACCGRCWRRRIRRSASWPFHLGQQRVPCRLARSLQVEARRAVGRSWARQVRTRRPAADVAVPWRVGRRVATAGRRSSGLRRRTCRGRDRR
jgi:hypothetical protein